MSLNLSAIAVRERAVTLFFILLLVAAGAYAFVMLGRAEDPTSPSRPDGHDGMAGRDGARDAGPRRRTVGEAASGTDLVRPGGDDRPGYAYMTVTLKDSTPPSVVQEEFYQARKKLGDEARNLPSGVFGPSTTNIRM